jgi:hypothetical protein
LHTRKLTDSGIACAELCLRAHCSTSDRRTKRISTAIRSNPIPTY